jgi:hypothetical protein
MLRTLTRGPLDTPLGRDYNLYVGLTRSGQEPPPKRPSTVTWLLWATAVFLFVLIVAVIALR